MRRLRPRSVLALLALVVPISLAAPGVGAAGVGDASSSATGCTVWRETNGGAARCEAGTFRVAVYCWLPLGMPWIAYGPVVEGPGESRATCPWGSPLTASVEHL